MKTNKEIWDEVRAVVDQGSMEEKESGNTVIWAFKGKLGAKLTIYNKDHLPEGEKVKAQLRLTQDNRVIFRHIGTLENNFITLMNALNSYK